MRSLIIFFVVAVLIALGAAWIAINPGQITIDWLDWRIETSVSTATFLFLAVIIGVVALQRLIYWLLREAPFSAPRRRESRRRRGMQALSKGVVALALGHHAEAQRHAEKARKLIGPSPMVLLLSAQAAQLAGNRPAADEQFRAMMDIEETAFLGVRGLLIRTLEDGDLDQALLLSNRAFELQPKGRWVLQSRLDLLSRLGKWPEARDTLRLLHKYKHISNEVSERHRAVLHHCEAIENDLAGRRDQALRLALEAHKLAPAFSPAAVFASRLLNANGDNRKAARILEESWQAAPHPLLAEAYANLSANETPTERLRRLEKLVAANPDHIESRLTLAAQSIAVQHWGEAREQLEKTLTMKPPVRAYRLLAEVERRDAGDEEAARKWEIYAVKAPADPEWVCRTCGAERHLWVPRCASCLSFDSFVWQSPGDNIVTLPARTPEFVGLPTLGEVET